MMSRFIQACRCMILVVACSTVTGIGHASTIDIDATASGWIKPNGDTNGHIGSTTNFLTGIDVAGDAGRSNFFVFDLSGVSGEIGSATLKLQNPDDGFYSFENDFFGWSNSYTYSLTSLVTCCITATDLLADNWSYPYTATAAWGQINGSTAVSYGSIQMNESSNGTILEILLSAAAVDDINTAINQSPGNNYFAIGGNLELPNTRVAYAFANTGFDRFSRTLTLSPVPVPPAFLLFFTGIAVLWRFVTRGADISNRYH